MRTKDGYDPMLPIGTDKCRCSVCGEYFMRSSTFDRHRIGTTPFKRCLSAEEMAAKGWTRGTPPHVHWRRPIAADSAMRIRQARTSD